MNILCNQGNNYLPGRKGVGKISLFDAIQNISRKGVGKISLLMLFKTYQDRG
jgi:hypothetical protein